MAITLETIQEAKKRISPYIVRTPLLRMQNLDSCIGVGAVLQRQISVSKNTKVCFVLSGGTLGRSSWMAC